MILNWNNFQTFQVFLDFAPLKLRLKNKQNKFFPHRFREAMWVQPIDAEVNNV